MRWDLIRWELKKLWSMPMIPVFLLLCILLNSTVLLSQWYRADYVSYVAEVTERIGGTMGDKFDYQLEQEPEHLYKKELIAATKGAENIYEDYHTDSILELVFSIARSSDSIHRLWEQKYQVLQTIVDRLAEQGAAMSLYAGEMSFEITRLLFQTLCRMVIAEGWITAILMALYLSGSEAFDRTALSVYCTKTGRSIQKEKYAATVVSGLIGYLLLLIAGLGLFSLLWDMGPLWSASISSQMNYRQIGIHMVPFLTWKPMTVGGYLTATVALGAICVLVYQTVAFAVGMGCRNALQAFFVLFGSGVTLYALVPFVARKGLWIAVEMLEWNPVMLWVNQYKWFTDMDIDSIVPWQECKVGLLGIVIGSLLLWHSYHGFCRKDVE